MCESRTIEETDESYFTTVDVEGGISITAYSNDGPKDVVIPCQIGGKYVVDIGAVGNAGALYSKSLTSVVLPNTLKTTSRYTFFNNQLNSVTISDSVTSIGDYEFYYNSNLKTVINKSSIPNVTLTQYFDSSPTITN